MEYPTTYLIDSIRHIREATPDVIHEPFTIMKIKTEPLPESQRLLTTKTQEETRGRVTLKTSQGGDWKVTDFDPTWVCLYRGRRTEFPEETGDPCYKDCTGPRAIGRTGLNYLHSD